MTDTNDDVGMELILFLGGSKKPEILITVKGNMYRVEAVEDGTITSSFEYDTLGSAVTRAGILISEYGGFYTVEKD